MSLLDNILAWATDNLAAWQRDAMRRLLQKQNLDDIDIDDLYAMLKASNGISDPKNRTPIPLAQEYIPTYEASVTPVILKGVRDLKHVNRIMPGSKIEFSPKGITVIYGANASGKSGYSRVLKRACRARDLSETVHPDATDPKAAANVPQATFDIEVGGVASSVDWIRDQTPPYKLSTIAVFDSHCARAYLDEENDVAYIPYGLDIVESLGQSVLPQLAKRLDSDIATINTDVLPFADLLGNTTVGKMISALSATTDPQTISNLATLTEVENQRLSELTKMLAENDPKTKATALRLSAKRIDALISRVEKTIAWVDDAAVGRLKACDEAVEAAQKAAAYAAEKFRVGDTLLPGTGELAWKELFEAARRFSIEVVYPNKPFPHITDDARCLLCQQSLNDEARKRIQRFDDFIKEDTAKNAADKSRHRKEETSKLESAQLDFGLDAATGEELSQLNNNILSAMKHFERQVEERRAWLLSAIASHGFTTPPPLDGDPSDELKALSHKINAQADERMRAADEEQKRVLEAERAELQARERLSSRSTAVIELIRRMKQKDMLKRCKDDLKTTAISYKAKEFANQAVTAALKNALNAEFEKLGVGHIKTKLSERVEKGKMKHKLTLDLPSTKNLNAILSEGEQRAIAIGSFLAELHLAGHNGGIVFDDPVSSLDHHWREKVACRLVEEAKVRQVIVFTHDTVFLGELCHEVENCSVDHVACHLEWMNGFPGFVSEGLPWEHMKVKERLDKLEQAQRTLATSWPSYPNEDDRTKMRDQYNFLRATIERVIQDVIFGGVVQRYRNWVSVNNLGDVVGFTESEYQEIERLHKTCCDVTSAHDPASAKNASVPDATQLRQDIEYLKKVVDSIKARQKIQKDQRKIARIPTTP